MISFFIAWLSVMFSLVFSPGPANILLAASGATQGITRSLPVLIGIDAVFLGKSILVGFGLAEIFARYPLMLTVMQYIGVVYLFWLAWLFLIKNSKPKQDSEKQHLGFRAGALLQIFNPKGWVLVALMFSLFAKPAANLWPNHSTIVLIVMLATLNISLHFIWIVIGSGLGKLSDKTNSNRTLNWLFSASLVFVAVWLAIDNMSGGLR